MPGKGGGFPEMPGKGGAYATGPMQAPAGDRSDRVGPRQTTSDRVELRPIMHTRQPKVEIPQVLGPMGGKGGFDQMDDDGDMFGEGPVPGKGGFGKGGPKGGPAEMVGKGSYGDFGPDPCPKLPRPTIFFPLWCVSSLSPFSMQVSLHIHF